MEAHARFLAEDFWEKAENQVMSRRHLVLIPSSLGATSTTTAMEEESDGGGADKQANQTWPHTREKETLSFAGQEQAWRT